jgi:hypothetical protein
MSERNLQYNAGKGQGAEDGKDADAVFSACRTILVNRNRQSPAGTILVLLRENNAPYWCNLIVLFRISRCGTMRVCDKTRGQAIGTFSAVLSAVVLLILPAWPVSV